MSGLNLKDNFENIDMRCFQAFVHGGLVRHSVSHVANPTPSRHFREATYSIIVNCNIINLLWSLKSKLSMTFLHVIYGPCSRTGVTCVASDFGGIIWLNINYPAEI